MSANPFDDFEEDIIYAKPNGFIKKNVPAFFNHPKKKVDIHDISLDIEKGDKIVRPRPSGKSEEYTVESSIYHPSKGVFSVFGEFYEVKYSDKEKRSTNSEQTTINLFGSSSRININSTDNSNNNFNYLNQTFNDMRNAVQKAGLDDQITKDLLGRIEHLEMSAGTNVFKESYSDFITNIANHMTIFSPFIPALTNMIT